ncbi:hypothetical protein SS1G_00438 [Sclerotinia sclerotiorum 1980 UF-70]|uniref:Cohesin loading factor n=2 Tax=Sclerotinia sclerotiorum (strain ATCC 18683 / 1980 / Ss-1) TaxID=665079 RepID=A7E566_SCLS1|nr:hypothetical protein SS1G_00438 [Sclerotinia sclerotiorum 1980 UF-70]APA07940.1 hypothetical protein sscle_03g027100 [Sclerotinia sclerotiorum 1980 UF-70]EDN91038.1 hypothetical protein SS1G_00438 [Sclerotinia sclerotiorum 1980 UF-70]
MSQNHGMPNIWPSYDPNTYPPQGNSSQHGRNGMMMQNGGNMQRYQMGGDMQQDQTTYWNSNTQPQYDMPATGYAPNNIYTAPSTAPQYYQPQVQVQVQIPQPVQQHYPIDQSRPQHHVQSSSNIPMEQINHQMAHTKPPIAPLNYPLLMVSLAEEYFGAAHELAPAVAVAMTEENVHEYHKLITMGLECLTIALKQLKLPARLEAKVRLRMAGIIYEETNNYAEAETMLGQGIILCERNHYYDLKYVMQFLLARLMFEKNPKASMKTLDSHISDAQAYQHNAWIYVFRFLRASHALQLRTPSDNHAAIQNLRSISYLANHQGDRSIYIVASLMEAIAHLKSSGVDGIEHVQRAIAAARTYQLDNKSNIPQLIGLTHILDVICSILRGDPAQMLSTLRAMQLVMDDLLKNPAWSIENDTLAIPIDSVHKVKHLITPDTRNVLSMREDGRGQMAMSFLNKRDAYALTYLLSGIVLMHKNPLDQKAVRFLHEGLGRIKADESRAKASPGLLSEIIAKKQWRGLILCYSHMYMAFCCAAVGDWVRVKQEMSSVATAAEKFEIPLSGRLGTLTLYLEGVYLQGTGDLKAALKIFQHETFELYGLFSEDEVERDVAILAALNVLLILQDELWQDPIENVTLISKLEPYCVNHPTKDIQTAFSIIRATVKTSNSAMIHETKNHLSAALAKAKASHNTQFLCLVLNVMCSKFFNNCLGEQAEKSALAALKQANHSKNKLWISVAEGLLAQFYDISGKRVEAQATFEDACAVAHEALPGH